MADYEDVAGKPVTISTQIPDYEDVTGKKVTSNNPSAAPTDSQSPLESRVRGIQKTLSPLAANALPMAGSFLGPLGTVAGFLVQHGLQKLSPSDFGQPSEGWDVPVEAGKDVLLQNAIPGLVGKGLGAAREAFQSGPGQAAKNLAARIMSTRPFSWNPAVQEAVGESKVVEQSLPIAKKLFPKSAVIETAAQNAQDVFNPQGLHSVDEEMLPSLYKKDSVAADLLKVPYEQTTGSGVSLEKIETKALSSVEQVRNWKLATGEPSTIRQLGLNNAIKQGYNSGTGEINPDKILETLNGPKSDIYDEAIGDPKIKANLTDLLNTVKETQANLPKNQTGYQGLIRYAQHRLVFELPWLLSGHAVGGMVGMAGGMILTDTAISHLMSNPEIAALTVQAAKTGLKAPEAGLISHALLGALRGIEVYLTTPEGGQEKVTVGQDGKLQYPIPPQKP